MARKNHAENDDESALLNQGEGSEDELQSQENPADESSTEDEAGDDTTAAEGRMVSVTVARGKSVYEGRGKHHKPGDRLKLKPDEAKRLTDLGFVTRQRGVTNEQPEGASVNKSEGPSVKSA